MTSCFSLISLLVDPQLLHCSGLGPPFLLKGSLEETVSSCGCVMWLRYRGNADLASSPEAQLLLLIFFKLCFYCLYRIIPNAIVVSHTNLNQGPTFVEGMPYSPLPSAWLTSGHECMRASYKTNEFNGGSVLTIWKH